MDSKALEKRNQCTDLTGTATDVPQCVRLEEHQISAARKPMSLSG